MKQLIIVFIGTCLLTASAQTNLTFQNCQAGDFVKVKCDRPLLVLGKAILLEVGSNTVTVCTANDRFTLKKADVALVPLTSRSAMSAFLAGSSVLPGPASVAPSTNRASAADNLQTLAGKVPAGNPMQSRAQVEKMILGGHTKDPGYAKAGAYYNRTMDGVMDGTISQAELVRQAKETLAKCDEYKAERGKDPQFEEVIKVLRDFVRRSEAGEKFDFATPVQ